MRETPEQPDSSGSSGYGHLFGQTPATGGSAPTWLRRVYTWALVCFPLTLATWAAFRLFGASRGDIPQATASVVIGVVLGTIVTVWAHKTGRRRRRGTSHWKRG